MSEDTTTLELTVYCSDAKVTQAELDTTDLCHSTAIRRSYEASDNVDDVESGLTTLKFDSQNGSTGLPVEPTGMSTEAIDEQMHQMNAAVSVAAAQPDVELP